MPYSDADAWKDVAGSTAGGALMLHAELLKLKKEYEHFRDTAVNQELYILANGRWEFELGKRRLLADIVRRYRNHKCSGAKCGLCCEANNELAAIERADGK